MLIAQTKNFRVTRNLRHQSTNLASKVTNAPDKSSFKAKSKLDIGERATSMQFSDYELRRRRLKGFYGSDEFDLPWERLRKTPVRVGLLGPPGVGKSTFASLISGQLGWPVISSGDILRDEIRLGTELGKAVKELTERGDLVPDELITKIILGDLASFPNRGFILDGFPRTLKQAKSLQKSEASLDATIVFSLPYDILVEKSQYRLVCVACHENYNMGEYETEEVSMPRLMPQTAGICDRCHNILEHRPDDNSETIKHRIDVHYRTTKEVVDYYDRIGIQIKWKVKRGVNDYPKIIYRLAQSINRQKARKVSTNEELLSSGDGPVKADKHPHVSMDPKQANWN